MEAQGVEDRVVVVVPRCRSNIDNCDFDDSEALVCRRGRIVGPGPSLESPLARARKMLFIIHDES